MPLCCSSYFYIHETRTDADKQQICADDPHRNQTYVVSQVIISRMRISFVCGVSAVYFSSSRSAKSHSGYIIFDPECINIIIVTCDVPLLAGLFRKPFDLMRSAVNTQAAGRMPCILPTSGRSRRNGTIVKEAYNSVLLVPLFLLSTCV